MFRRSERGADSSRLYSPNLLADDISICRQSLAERTKSSRGNGRSGRRCMQMLRVAVSLSLLTGCVTSGAPILTDAQPLLGRHARLHLYSVSDGKADEFQKVSFRWDGKQYIPVGRNDSGIASFTLHRFDSEDWIAQTARATRGAMTTEYAYVRKLADGVHIVNVIDEQDADETTRKQFCEKTSAFDCRISTSDQLLTFSRATAAKQHTGGGLVIEVSPTRSSGR